MPQLRDTLSEDLFHRGYIHRSKNLFVEAYEPLVKDMATDLNMLVVSVEYRLAPDHPFPVPMNDCYDATLHFLENAEEFEVDPQRISLAGIILMCSIISLSVNSIHVHDVWHRPLRELQSHYIYIVACQRGGVSNKPTLGPLNT